jgi:hypothetical protein
MALQQAEITYAVNQAWIGFWRSFMPGSVLPYDEQAVEALLDGQEVKAEVLAPQSELYDRLEGDDRISGITLADVLMGIEDYFTIFRQIRRQNYDAWDYFRRVGAPICMNSAAIYRGVIDKDLKPIVNAETMPAFLGLFFPRTREEHRAGVMEDKPSLLDFHLYEKRRRNIVVVSPWKWKIYDHQMYSLDRDVFTEKERKKFPACGAFGMHYFIGIGEDGHVEAMPMHMPKVQRLPDGEAIHHNRFIVPPGLEEMAHGAKGKEKLNIWTVNEFVARLFAIIRAYVDSATSGVQVTIRHKNQTARFGLPLSYCKSFFADRHSNGKRRNALLHFVGEYTYVRANGKVVTVGEHLRGARHFTWRDYSIVLSAPGIHHPAPEALAAETLHDDDILPFPDKDLVLFSKGAGNKVRDEINNRRKNPFRKGRPTHTYKVSNLETRQGLSP